MKGDGAQPPRQLRILCRTAGKERESERGAEGCAPRILIWQGAMWPDQAATVPSSLKEMDDGILLLAWPMPRIRPITRYIQTHEMIVLDRRVSATALLVAVASFCAGMLKAHYSRAVQEGESIINRGIEAMRDTDSGLGVISDLSTGPNCQHAHICAANPRERTCRRLSCVCRIFVHMDT